MIGTLIGSRIEIVILGPEEPCFVNADAGQFETAIINMAVNARDAMEGRGRLTIAVGMAASLPNAAPSSQNPYGYVAVSVADTGSGIPPDQFERIFEPFFTTKQAGHGTGLGLSQVFGFARQSGGEVAVASEVGKGSIFTLYLPRTAGSGKSRQLPAEDARALDGRGMSVLVVEDNAEVGQFATDALADLGYTTRLVGSATHALEELAAGADRFDVVFTDVVMPGHDRHRTRPGNPPPPRRPAGRADQRLQPRAVGTRQLRFRAAAKALFRRAALARAAPGRPPAQGWACQGSDVNRFPVVAALPAFARA